MHILMKCIDFIKVRGVSDSFWGIGPDVLTKVFSSMKVDVFTLVLILCGELYIIFWNLTFLSFFFFFAFIMLFPSDCLSLYNYC